MILATGESKAKDLKFVFCVKNRKTKNKDKKTEV